MTDPTLVNQGEAEILREAGDSVLADELMGIYKALGEIPEFDVAVPDLRMDTYLARRILREAAASLSARSTAE